ncbi:MAG: peroxiredoxin family protein [Pyrinomonadaceae bacterium]
MDKINQKLEMMATIFIIVVTIMLGVVITKQFFITSPAAAGQNNSSAQLQPANNSPLKIDGVDFSQQPKTVVLALQPGCHFCTESAPFYKRLIESSRDRNIKIVAVLPSSLKESQDYLQKLGIDNLEIKESSLNSLNVQGTPTLILANEKGEVINTWVGKLPASKEDDVINSILQ